MMKALPPGLERLTPEEAQAWAESCKRGNGAAPPENAGDVIPFSDEALTLAFSARHAKDLRYCDKFGQWFEWTGRLWRGDNRRRVFELARAVCREQCRLVGELIEDKRTAARLAHKVASSGSVAAIVGLARCDPRHATTEDDWDADPWLLNTPGGMIDLRTGRLGPHDPNALCSKITAVAPLAPPGGQAPEAKGCPLWLRFLDQVTAGDGELQAFLQRIVGYALTGDTSEHALFFLHGPGGNGKGVFLNTITAILADYASVASMDTFTSSQSDRHPTDLAMLRGARMVTAQETEEGRQWAASRVYALTGGDPITARFMRQDFFTYIPQFKLLMAGNHKPSLRSVDEAARRRFNLIPFTVKIPARQRDPKLPEKLKAEWPGILAWAIDGCLAWQRDGLNPPPAVREATEEYFEDENAFGRWVSECCTPDPHAHEATRDLYGAWKAWAERSGITPGTETKFRYALKAQGYKAKRLPEANISGFTGLRLNRRDYTDDPRYGG